MSCLLWHHAFDTIELCASPAGPILVVTVDGWRSEIRDPSGDVLGMTAAEFIARYVDGDRPPRDGWWGELTAEVSAGLLAFMRVRVLGLTAVGGSSACESSSLHRVRTDPKAEARR